MLTQPDPTPGVEATTALSESLNCFLRFLVPHTQMEIGFGYILIRSAYTPCSILRGTIGLRPEEGLSSVDHLMRHIFTHDHKAYRARAHIKRALIYLETVLKQDCSSQLQTHSVATKTVSIDLEALLICQTL